MWKKFCKDVFTEKDGETFCPARALWILGSFVFFGLAMLAAFKGKDFDPQAYGIGLGTLTGLGGAGVMLKGQTE